jgi:succinoglycan biosynthesis protein ExoM
LLRQLLSKLEDQETDCLFEYSIVIVDNDSSASARQTAETFADHSNISISYYVEPEQNIALARNKTIENATGEFIGFIDDDEFPTKHWLLNLHKAINKYKSDGILGPVLPHFEEEPPQWILKGHFFDRPTHLTGHVLEWKNTRTGNALLRRELFNKSSMWFNPTFGSGGEDRDFFRRKIQEEHVFVWCNEAPVFETVHPERWKRTVQMKRAFLRGKMALNAQGFRSVNIFESVVAIALYTCCLPLFLFLGQHIFMKYLIKDCDHVGKVCAFIEIDLLNEKYVRG